MAVESSEPAGVVPESAPSAESPDEVAGSRTPDVPTITPTGAPVPSAMVSAEPSAIKVVRAPVAKPFAREKLSGAAALATVRAAAQKADDAGTVSFRLTSVMELIDLIDVSEGVSSMALPTSGAYRVRGSHSAASAPDSRVIVAPPTIYVTGDQFEYMDVTKSKEPWLAGAMKETEGFDVVQMALKQLAISTPRTMPSFLIKALSVASEATERGSATIGRARTRHFLVTVTYAELAHAYDSDLAGQFGVGPVPPGSVRIDAWLDDEGMVRRIGWVSEEESETVTTMDVLEYGVPLDVTAPAADQTRDLRKPAS